MLHNGSAIISLFRDGEQQDYPAYPRTHVTYVHFAMHVWLYLDRTDSSQPRRIPSAVPTTQMTYLRKSHPMLLKS